MRVLILAADLRSPALALALLAAGCTGKSSPTAIRLDGPLGAHQFVSYLPTPAVPNEACRRAHTGLVVAKIVLEPSGGLKEVTFAQAPDSHCSRAVEKSIRMASFRLPPQTPHSFVGKLYFYFRVDRSGKTLVLVPGDPRLADWREDHANN